MKNSEKTSTSINVSQVRSLLLAGATLLLLAAFNPAVADHCKGKHKNDPGCDGGGGGGGGGGSALDAYTENNGFCNDAYAELFGDTRDFEGPGTGYQHCQNTMAGSGVPKSNRALFTDFQRCIVNMTIPGAGSEITLIKASFNSLRDKKTGEIGAVSFFFEDDNGVKYEADLLLVPFLTIPDASGYSLQIDGTASVFTRGGGADPVFVGDVCVDTVVYEPVP